MKSKLFSLSHAATIAALLAAALAHAAPIQEAVPTLQPPPEAASGYAEKSGWAASKYMVAAANPLAVDAGYQMLKQGGGAIVNLSSTSGLRWTGAAQVAYAATKAGVIQLSRVLAVQYAPDRIRVNCVVPGQLHTPMVETRLAGQRAGGDVQALLAQRQSRIPLPFMGDGRDTAAAALFLASDEARFITGTEIVVDGGMSVRCD